MAKKTTKKNTTPSYPIEVGKVYLFRLATVYDLGRVKAIYSDCILLSDASWVADTGRFHVALKDGKLNENEPFGRDVVIYKGAIVDACEWTGSFPYGVA